MNTKRKSLYAVITCFIALFAAAALFTSRFIHEERLDTALIKSIESNNDSTALALLRQGADPNAHKKVHSSRSMWRVLWDILTGKRSGTTGTTALQVAVGVDLKNQPNMFNAGGDPASAGMQSSYTILKALLQDGALWETDTTKPKPSQVKAEQILKDRSSRLPFEEDKFDRQKTQDALSKAILLEGGSARAYMGLADCWMSAGDYAAAAHWFRVALLWQQSDVAAKLGLATAERYLRIQQSISEQLPRGFRVLHVLPYPNSFQAKLWVAVYCIEHTGEHTGLQLAMYEDRPSGLTRLSAVGNLNYSDWDGWYNDEVRLFISSFSRGGYPQLVVEHIMYGADWEPSHMAIFAWRQGKLVNTLNVDGDIPFAIKEINHGGSYQVVAYSGIGPSMTFGEKPKWTDIYSFKNGRFVKSNKDYPKEFGDWVRILRATLQDHPGDNEIIEHLHMAYDILGKHMNSLNGYSRGHK